MEKKNYLKTILIILFVILPLILISINMFLEPLGYAIFLNNNEDIKLVFQKENYKIDDTTRVIIINSKLDSMTIINSNFKIETFQVEKESEVAKYLKENGIDIFNIMNWISYIYILIIFGIIFWRKLFETSEFYRTFEDNDI